MKTLLLREIDVQVIRIEPKTRNQDTADPDAPPTTSTRYVFGLRPLRMRRTKAHHYLNELNGSYARGWWELEDVDDDGIEGSPEDDGSVAVPVAHEVTRTYSQCRALYARLLALTDVNDQDACWCALGSCPFWSLAGVLRATPFPRKTLFNQSSRVLASRARALSAMIRDLLSTLRGCYRARHFREQRVPFHGIMACKVLGTIGVFLELDDPAVEDKLRIGERRLHSRLSLEGWLEHRRSSLTGCGPLPLAAANSIRSAGCGVEDAERERKTSEGEATQSAGFLV
jgi:hypothetical protein